MAVALGAREGEIALHVDKHGSYAPSLKRIVKGLRQIEMVPITTVDSLISQGHMQSPKVVKIDVEGAEGDVLAGMQQTLLSPRRPTSIFLELHDLFLPQFGTNKEELLAQIAALGINLTLSLRSENMSSTTILFLNPDQRIQYGDKCGIM